MTTEPIDGKEHPDKARRELLEKNEELNRLLALVGTGKREWEVTMDCIDDMVLLSGRDGVVRRVNRTFHSFTGKGYEELAGQPMGDLLASAGFALPEAEGAAEERLHEASGRWFVLHRYSFEDESVYRLGGTVVTIHDTTELRQTSRELESKNRELTEALVELKNSQAKVLQQEKMASIGQLAAGVAHEINNPIGFVSSNLVTLRRYLGRVFEYIDVLTAVAERSATPAQRTELEEKRRTIKLDMISADLGNLLKESLEGTERVTKIVSDLKTFSRVDEAVIKTVDINSCIESTINIVRNELKYKATLVKEMGKVPPLRCYPQQINQVVMNLLLNAVQAIEKEGTITVRSWEEPGSVRFSVSDTGCGIPAERIRRIFEPFYTTKDVGKGTGLGLSITYDIVKRHAGEITVDSEVGRGTTFTVTIPVTETTT